MTDSELKALLDSEAERINSKDFIADDPVQFPRRFTDKRDIEIAALLCSSIAWGNRRMICRDCDRMLELMDNMPYQFMMEGAYEAMDPDMNLHRTFFARNFQHFMRGLRSVYERYGTLDDFCRESGASQAEQAPWALADALNRMLADANDGRDDSRCLPVNTRTTALKRLNMALRWLVRRDGIVDLGIWQSLTPAQLYIPLDVHVNRTARSLGLLTRKAADRRSVLELTDKVRVFRPDDPAIYDYALFGVGIEGRGVGRLTDI